METTEKAASAAVSADGLNPAAQPLVMDGDFQIQRLTGPQLMLGQWEVAADVWQGSGKPVVALSGGQA